MSLARRIAAVGAGLAAAALVLPAAGSPAGASTTAPPPAYTVTTGRVQAAAGWLATQFVGSHYLPTPGGDRFVSGVYGGKTYLNYGENADAIFGLAAAKAGATKIASALAFLAANVDAYTDISDSASTGDGTVGKLALTAIVAGANPTAFGGFDLLKQLKDDECTAVVAGPCAAPGASRNTYASASESFVVLAEARAGGTYAPSAAKVAYYLSLQCTGGAGAGGFTGDLTACGSGPADLDATSYAVMALQALGGHTAELARAVAWLKAQQKPGGYWTVGGKPNTNSTGLAAAALQGAGADVAAARAWLLAQQVPAGHPGAGALRFEGTVEATTAAVTSPSVIATAQGLTGLVDRGSLATVSASGAAETVPLYAPVSGVSSTHPTAGHRVTVTGTGFVAGERVQVRIQSAPTTVATVTADPLGTARATFTVPTGLTGAHPVVLTGLTSELRARSAVTVRASVASPASTSAPPTRAASTIVTAPAAATPAAGLTVAETGQNRRQLDTVAALGAFAVLAGVGLLLIGRRRAH